MNHHDLIAAGHLETERAHESPEWSTFAIYIASNPSEEVMRIESTGAAKALLPNAPEEASVDAIRARVLESLCEFLTENRPDGFHARVAGEGWTTSDAPAPLLHLFPILSGLKNTNRWAPEIERTKDCGRMWLGVFAVEPGPDSLTELYGAMVERCELGMYSLWSARPSIDEIASLLYGHRHQLYPQLDLVSAIPGLRLVLICSQFDDFRLVSGAHRTSETSLVDRLLAPSK